MTSQQPEQQTDDQREQPPSELVAWLRRFRGTQRAERFRRDYPDADAEADRAIVAAHNAAHTKRLAAGKTAADEVLSEIDRGDRR